MQFVHYNFWNVIILNNVSYFVILDTIYVNLPAKVYLIIQPFRAFVKIMSIPDEVLFSKTAVVCIASHLYDVLLGFETEPLFEAVHCFIYGRQRMVVALDRMISLVPAIKAPLKNYTCNCERYEAFDIKP